VTEVEAAAAALMRGEVVVIPTDTVYGIAASPSDTRAVDAIFAVKGRERAKALPVLGASREDLAAVASFDARAGHLAARFWPGPLTLVLPRAPSFTADLGGTDDATVAVRVPRHPLTLDILRRCGPLAVTSANRSGEPAPSTAEEARAALRGHDIVIVDGGAGGSEPSTIVSLVDGFEVLREGALPLDVLENL